MGLYGTGGSWLYTRIEGKMNAELYTTILDDELLNTEVV